MEFSPIAIVGRACLLPGAHSPEALWEAVATTCVPALALKRLQSGDGEEAVRVPVRFEPAYAREGQRAAQETLHNRRQLGEAGDELKTAVIGGTALFQLADALAIFALAQGLDLPIPLAVCLLLNPFIYLSMVLPISLGGLGVREGVVIAFFALLALNRFTHSSGSHTYYVPTWLVAHSPLSPIGK